MRRDMKAVFAIVACIFGSTAVAGECPGAVPKPVEARMLPVLDALGQALRKNDIWDKRYEGAFDSLLRRQDAASREARVALLDYYLGEAFDEELVCAVAKDGSSKLLDLYSRCDIAPSRAPVPRAHSSVKRDFAKEIIASGRVTDRCTYD